MSGRKRGRGAEEAALEDELFGAGGGGKRGRGEGVLDAGLFGGVEESGGGWVGLEGGEAAEASEGGGGAAWEDDDEEKLEVNVAAAPRLRKFREKEGETVLSGREYEKRLREEFRRRVGVGEEWVRGGAGEKGGGGEGILESTGGVRARGGLLPRGEVVVSRVADGNHASPSGSVVNCTQFHPSGSTALLLVAGLDRRLRFFDPDGEKNRLVHSTVLSDLPVRTAHFVHQGASVLATGRRPFFYLHDVATGTPHRVPQLLGRHERAWEVVAVSHDDHHSPWAFAADQGHVVLVAPKAKTVAGVLPAVRGGVRALSWGLGGRELWVGSDVGELSCFDVRMGRRLFSFMDEGGSGVTSLCCSPTGTEVAVGSDSGVVNIYSLPYTAPPPSTSVFTTSTASPSPTASISNLVTRIHGLQYNHDGQMLALHSHSVKDALRLHHTASRSIFSNWPTAKTPLSYVQSVAFSPNSKFTAIGNDKGKVLLYNMKHFKEY